MPQMAPISWLCLFIMFSTALILFSIMNYFSFLPPSPQTSKSLKFKNNFLNWKW